MFWGFLFGRSQVLPVDTGASRIKGGVLSLNTIMVPHPLQKVMKNHPWKMATLFWRMWYVESFLHFLPLVSQCVLLFLTCAGFEGTGRMNIRTSIFSALTLSLVGHQWHI